MLLPHMHHSDQPSPAARSRPLQPARHGTERPCMRRRRSHARPPQGAGRLRAALHQGRRAHQRCGAQRAVSLVAATEAGMQALAAGFAARLCPGDTYLLQGAVGAGKTAFRHASAAVRLQCWCPLSRHLAPPRALMPGRACSRAFVRAAMDDPDFPVPSPTFTLQNVYDEHQGAPTACCARRLRRWQPPADAPVPGRPGDPPLRPVPPAGRGRQAGPGRLLRWCRQPGGVARAPAAQQPGRRAPAGGHSAPGRGAAPWGALSWRPPRRLPTATPARRRSRTAWRSGTWRCGGTLLRWRPRRSWRTGPGGS